MTHVFPRVFGRELPDVSFAKGALIHTVGGRTYIDGAGGALVVGVGHGDQTIIDALADQARRVSYVHATQFRSASVDAYAGELAALLPLDDARVYPVSGGSEATETALKMARAYHLARGEPERTKVVARAVSYHGNTLNALDASGRPALRAPYEPWLGRTVRVSSPDEYRCTDTGHESCARRFADELASVLEEQGPETIACFIGEPVVGAAQGAMVPPDGYWNGIAEVCDRYGVLLIADEVMTGFGRTGAWFACEHFGLRPDLVTGGKGASSGYWPFGFAACSGRVYAELERSGFVHGFTFSHSPVGAAVARAVLHRLAEDDLVSASRTKGERLKRMLGEALSSHPHVGDVRGRGLMIGVEFVADRATKRPFPRLERVTERLVQQALDLGLTVYPASGCAGSEGDAIMLGPPFVIGEQEMQRAAEKVAEAVETVLEDSRIP